MKSERFDIVKNDLCFFLYVNQPLVYLSPVSPVENIDTWEMMVQDEIFSH